MASDNEPAKLLLPYLQRADELQKHEPLVAYYCRLYAMERGLKIPQSERTKTTNSLLISLMKQLEKDKKSLQLGPDDHFHLEGFASNVFAKADKQDRAGRADLNTAKTFYAASIFFEILNQFGELLPDLEQKQKYAAWKAADIRKAIKEGRKPVPGPPGGDKELSMLSSTSSGEYDLDPSRTDEADLRTEPDPSPQFHDQVHHPHRTPPPDVPLSPSNSYPTHDFPPPPSNNLPDNSSYSSHPPPSNNIPDNSSYPQPPSNNIPDNPSYPQPPSNNIPDNPSYSKPPYHHQSYPQEPPPPPQHFPQNYPSHEAPTFSYPNFQSYPSFADTSLPTAPPNNNYPSFHEGGTDASYPTSSPPPPPPQNYPTAASQYNNSSSSSRHGSSVPEAAAPTKVYHYDSSYQPPPENVALAHKAARFAVGALAFDDVAIAVDYLKKSLELLTNPSSSS